MGKHHLPATLTQPPTPEPGLKLARFPSQYTPSGLDEFHPDTTRNPEVSR